MATIRKRNDRWQVQVRRIGYPAISKSFLAKADAEKWAREKERAIDRHELPINLSDLKHTTVGDLLKRYQAKVTATKRGQKVEDYRIGTMLKHEIADISLKNLTAADIAQYRDDRLQVVSACSVLKELAILQHMFALAIKDWGIPLHNNPVACISKPKQHNARDRRLEGDELERLDEALKLGRNPLVRLVFRFAIHTGMRRGEILALDWSAIDLKARTAYLALTKNGHSRTVPLSPAAIDVLNELPSRSGRVFPITIETLRYRFSEAVDLAKVEDFHLHDCRHEAVSRFFELGLSVPEVSLISGHKDPRMLARYTHLKPEIVAAKLECARQLDQHSPESIRHNPPT